MFESARASPFAQNVNPARALHEKKVELLREHLHDFFDSSLDQIGHIVDGSTYDLTLRIQVPPGEFCDAKYIQALQLTRKLDPNLVDKLPSLLNASSKCVRIKKQRLDEISKAQEQLSHDLGELKKFLSKRVESVKMMIFSSEIMRNLMMDLLDLAQMENNTFKLNKGYFSMTETVKKAFGVVGHVAEKKNVALVLEPIDPSV